MKGFITPTYTFTPGLTGVGTIDLNGIQNFDIKRLVAIINTRTNGIIYSVADPALGYTNINNTLITLNADTSTMSSSDLLSIIYDTNDAITNNELIEAIEALRMAVQALTRSGLGQTMPDTAARLRIALESISANLTLATITSVTTVSTVSTVSNQTQIGGFLANDQIPSLMKMSADSLRRNITVT
jgi:hypothetical protein